MYFPGPSCLANLAVVTGRAGTRSEPGDLRIGRAARIVSADHDRVAVDPSCVGRVALEVRRVKGIEHFQAELNAGRLAEEAVL